MIRGRTHFAFLRVFESWRYQFRSSYHEDTEPVSYSSRKAVIGLTLAPCSAGTRAAAAATSSTKPAAAA